MKILIVEDDTLLLQGLILAAQTEGYACDGVSTARAAEQCLETGHYSLVVLDLGLPDEDGLHFLNRIRQKKYTVPVLILTARDTVKDRVSGLDVGADDYLVKPFALEELHARIRALLRRTETENGTLRCGILEVDPGQHIVRVRGQETILTQKEFEVLCLLLRNPGQVLSREQLIENVWGYAFTGESRTVDVHVRTLRQKLGEAGAYIETVRGYGYKISPVN